MGKMSRDKGAAYERKVAKIFGKHFDRDLRRVPLSGGLDIKCDIYDPKNDDFPFFIECKNRKDFRVTSLLQGEGPLFDIYTKCALDASGSHLLDKYVQSVFPLVVFRGGDFKIDMVMFTRLIFEIFPVSRVWTDCSFISHRGTFYFMPVLDFLPHIPSDLVLQPKKHDIKILDEDDGETD